MNGNGTAGSFLGWRRFSMMRLVITITALFVTMPFVENLRSGALIESILLTLVLGSAVMAIGERKHARYIAIPLAVVALAGRWTHDLFPSLLPPEVFLIGGIFFVSFVITSLLRFVLTSPKVDTEVLCASIAAYLLLALVWTLGYWLIAESIPNAFAFSAAPGAETSVKGFNGLYFSLITMCTVGYGDITPVAKIARMLAAMQAMVGLLYVAILIARLVAVYSSKKSL